MSRLRLLPLLLLLVSPRAWAAIAFDATAANSVFSSGHSGAGPYSITVTIVAGETAFAAILIESATQSVTGITGGGAWTKIGSVYANGGANAESELWTNGVGGGVGATSISVSLTGNPAGTQTVTVGQYTGVGTIQNGNVVTATNTASTATASLGLNTSALGSFLIASLVAGSGSTTLVTGTRPVTNGALFTNTSAAPSAITVSATCSSGAGASWAVVGVEIYPSGILINFDPVPADVGSAAGTTSPLAVTFSVVSHETGFCAIGFDGTISGDSVTGITGGGTWSLVKAENAATGSRAELWTNGVSGGSAASSVSIAFAGTVVEVTAVCGQYIGAGAILTANAIGATGTTTSPATVSVTTTNLNSFVVGAFAVTGSFPVFAASTGALRGTISGGSVGAAALNDNASATNTSTTTAVTVAATHTNWAAVAVELALSSSTPGWMSWGFGQ